MMDLSGVLGLGFGRNGEDEREQGTQCRKLIDCHLHDKEAQSSL
jgi:hypothetical protein